MMVCGRGVHNVFGRVGAAHHAAPASNWLETGCTLWTFPTLLACLLVFGGCGALGPDAPAADRDGDGLSDTREMALGTDPDDPDIVYGGSYDGFLTRVNHRTGERRTVTVWPDNPMGHGAEDYKYRFQWNFPIKFSRHDSNVLYTAAQVLFKTTNEGQSWEAISGDLTRNDPSTQKSSGGPLTQDNTSIEYYGTIFTLEEGSARGVIWTGSDDGLIHITRNGGDTWTNVTPPKKIIAYI